MNFIPNELTKEEHEIQKALLYLKDRKFEVRKTFNRKITTYFLKHRAENFLREYVPYYIENSEEAYVSSEAIAKALEIKGYKTNPVRSSVSSVTNISSINNF